MLHNNCFLPKYRHNNIFPGDIESQDKARAAQLEKPERHDTDTAQPKKKKDTDLTVIPCQFQTLTKALSPQLPFPLPQKKPNTTLPLQGIPVRTATGRVL